MTPIQITGNDTVAQVLAKTTKARAWLAINSADLPQVSPQFTLRVSAHIPGSSPAVVDVFEPAFLRLHQMTGGAIQVKAFWGGSLHKEREGIEALKSGLTDMCPVYSAWDADMFPAAQALSLPFIFDSAEGATAVSEALYDKYFSKDFTAQGVYMGRMVATSEYNLFSREPIRTLADIQGKKIACSNGVESDLFKALGAIPIGCSTPEGKAVYERGDVFAISISDSAAHTVGLYRHANFRTSANLVRVNLEYGLSPAFFNQLPDDLKIILNQWLRTLAQAGAQLFYGLAGARACEVFLQNGMEFITLDPSEQAIWRETVAPVKDQLIAQLNTKGYPGSAMVEEIVHWAKHYAEFSADELIQETLDHPFMDLLPLP